jgi:hypothetical protein
MDGSQSILLHLAQFIALRSADSKRIGYWIALSYHIIWLSKVLISCLQDQP